MFKQNNVEFTQVRKDLVYPHRLNLYDKPPELEISIEDFEQYALDRLQILKAIEASVLRNKPDAETQKYIDQLSEKHLPLHSNHNRYADLDQERKKDHISHFILRLAYCRTEELRQWFVKQETFLFRLRFINEDLKDRQVFLKDINFDLKMITPQEKENLRDLLRESAPTKSVDTEQYFEVDFEQVPDLIGRRMVYLRNGKAYVPASEQIALVLNEYKKRLIRALEVTAKALPRMDEDERLIPVLNNVSKQYGVSEYKSFAGAGKVHANEVDSLVEHFPLCMKYLHQKLRENSHLRHGGRMQYGLFLKGLGLNIEEALAFWKMAFKNINEDQFQKQYAYNIRHNYGLEGKRANYTPYSCAKIISGNQPGPLDHHGCPFRHFSADNLKKTLVQNNALEGDVHEILSLASNGHYQIACTKYFELAHKSKSQGDSNVNMEEIIQHPNQYVEQSLALKKP